jgi:hypothetical protein
VRASVTDECVLGSSFAGELNNVSMALPPRGGGLTGLPKYQVSRAETRTNEQKIWGNFVTRNFDELLLPPFEPADSPAARTFAQRLYIRQVGLRDSSLYGELKEFIRNLSIDRFDVRSSEEEESLMGELQSTIIPWLRRWKLDVEWAHEVLFFSIIDGLRGHAPREGDQVANLTEDVWNELTELRSSHRDHRDPRLEKPPAPIPSFNPLADSEKQYLENCARIAAAHIASQKRVAESLGYRPVKKMRARRGDLTARVEWLVEFQVLEWSYAKIASRRKNVSQRAVEHGVRQIAELIDLPLRTKRTHT